MRPSDLLEALGGVSPRHLKSLELLYGKEPRWKRAGKAVVRFAACAAVVAATVGVILAMLFLQNRPNTPSDPAASSAAAPSQKPVSEVEKTTLKVLAYGGDEGNSEIESAIRTVARWYQDQHEAVEIQVEFVPENAERGGDWLVSLRESIADGNGPDVYLLPTLYSGQQVFEDVESAMRHGRFYDISQLYDGDEDLNREGLQQQVMEAGVVNGRRYVLPLGFDVPMVFANETAALNVGIDLYAIEMEGIDTLYREANSSQDKSAIFAAWNAPYVTDGLNLFPEVIDYDAQTVLLTAEEISSQLYYHHRAAQVAERQPPEGDSGSALSLFDEGCTIAVQSLAGSVDIMGLAQCTGTPLRAFPLESGDGSLVANVTYWGAVDAKCENAETAYDFLRLFLTPQVQHGTGFGEGYDTALSGIDMGWPVLVEGSAQALWELSCEKYEQQAEGATDDMDGESVISQVIGDMMSSEPGENGRSRAGWTREELAAITIGDYDFPWTIDRVRFVNAETDGVYEEALELAEDSDRKKDYQHKAEEMIERLGNYLEYADFVEENAYE